MGDRGHLQRYTVRLPLLLSTFCDPTSQTELHVGAALRTCTLTRAPDRRGAKVVIANRNRERADQLAAALGSGVASSCSWDDLAEGRVGGDVLANSTSVGMAPRDTESPVPAHVAAKVGLGLWAAAGVVAGGLAPGDVL